MRLSELKQIIRECIDELNEDKTTYHLMNPMSRVVDKNGSFKTDYYQTSKRKFNQAMDDSINGRGHDDGYSITNGKKTNIRKHIQKRTGRR